MKKNCKKLVKKNERMKEKVLKGKGDEFYVKWNWYDNRFNRCIDKKDLI